jgi:hypothetical protein
MYEFEDRKDENGFSIIGSKGDRAKKPMFSIFFRDRSRLTEEADEKRVAEILNGRYVASRIEKQTEERGA